MGRYHPSEPHWYLPLIGVDPFWQCNEIGSALMKQALTCASRDKKILSRIHEPTAYLALRSAMHSRLLGTIQAGTSPPITPMLRKPR